MVQNAQTGRRFDPKTYSIRFIKNIVIIFLAGILVKYALFDSTVISNTQMAPGLLYGDHVLVYKTFSLPLFRTIFPVSNHSPVIFDMPDIKSKRSCLRVSGISKDTVSIDSANFYLNGELVESEFKQNNNIEVLPREYSPRDYFEQYAIPGPKDTIQIYKLSIRDFFFTYSIVAQESNTPLSFKADLLIDDTLSNDYIINGFSLYSGTFKDIPEPSRSKWFFWIQLEQYLKYILPDQTIKFRFSLMQQDEEIRTYVVKKSYAFLLADNWISGFDSRYFGPIKRSSIVGRPFIIWWSKDSSSSLKSIRISRIGRMVL